MLDIVEKALLTRAAEVADAVRWMSLPIPGECWHELQEQGLLRAEAPIPIAA